jgi:hypothetical protein
MVFDVYDNSYASGTNLGQSARCINEWRFVGAGTSHGIAPTGQIRKLLQMEHPAAMVLEMEKQHRADVSEERVVGPTAGAKQKRRPKAALLFAILNHPDLQRRLDLKSPGFQKRLGNILGILVPARPLPEAGGPDVLVWSKLKFLDDLFEGGHSGYHRANWLRLSPIRISTTLCHRFGVLNVLICVKVLGRDKVFCGSRGNSKILFYIFFLQKSTLKCTNSLFLFSE